MLLLARSPAAAPARSWIEDWDTPLLVMTGARVEALRRIQRLAGLHGRPQAREGVASPCRAVAVQPYGRW